MLWHDFGGDRSLCWEHRYAIVLKDSLSDYSLRRNYGRTNTSINTSICLLNMQQYFGQWGRTYSSGSLLARFIRTKSAHTPCVPARLTMGALRLLVLWMDQIRPLLRSSFPEEMTI